MNILMSFEKKMFSFLLNIIRNGIAHSLDIYMMNFKRYFQFSKAREKIPLKSCLK